MPLYEYKCDSCGDVFEIIQKFADAPLVTHEVCGGPVRRLLSVSALQFKGTGWYVTDYARAGKNGKSAEAKSGDAKSSESKAAESKPGSTETKTETKKTESKPK